MKAVLILASLLFYNTALALNPTGTGWTKTICASSSGSKICKKPAFNYLGVKLNISVPNGLGFAFIGRPLKFLQFELGGTTTLVGGGIKTGALLFLPWYVSPSFHIEYGHQWAGDFNKLAVMFGAKNPEIAVFNNVEYDYLNFHGGLGFGHPNHFMIRFQAGYSYIWGQTNNFEQYLKTHSDTITAKEVSAKIWAPSAGLDFDFYF